MHPLLFEVKKLYHVLFMKKSEEISYRKHLLEFIRKYIRKYKREKKREKTNASK